MVQQEVKYERAIFDRRSDEDRRKVYNIQVVDQLGYDRRKPGAERRSQGEMRSDWARVSQWSSVCIPALMTSGYSVNS